MKRKKILILSACLLIITVMTFVSYLWKDFCNNWYYSGAHCFFLKNRSQDIIKVSTCAFWEEFVFRFAPFMVATILILFSKSNWWKNALYLISCIIIVCIQIQFGALHYNMLTDISYNRPIIIHGIQGIILVITYALTMTIILSDRRRQEINNKKGISIKRAIIANIIGYSCSVVVHATSNILLVLTQTF